ncbi:MAG TPA: hypothetical protein VMG82_25795 [Candidatus Sulfotelmatobacter sp.]|nr:hypothetical protein [Candidatus Sulfotelmatobacter sp.]
MEPATEQFAIRLKSCPDCTAQMPDHAAFCPGCGHAMQMKPLTGPKLALRRENLLGALAYVTFLPALVFLLRDPFRRDPFLRFHSVQCLLLWLVSVVAVALLRLSAFLLVLIPVIGPLLVVLSVTITALAALLVWIVAVVKAFQGERFALPLIGGLAEQYCNVP